MSIDLRFFKKENRDFLYKRNSHVPDITLTKHIFDSISKDFSKLNNRNHKPQVKIYFARYIRFENDCVILNCANTTKPNAGYKIHNSKTQEEQLFNDSDIYAADIYSDGECLYPFDFDNELLYAKNVTFHNKKHMQWVKNSLRKNDVIIAAAKRLKHPKHTQKYKPILHNTIEAIFKMAAINERQKLLLWPIGCGVFKNDPKIIAFLFVDKIKNQKISSFLKEIIMVIYDPQRTDKFFLMNLNLTYY